MPNFSQEVKTQDGHVKTVVAGSEEELAEGVAAVKGDRQAVSPDLHSPEVANEIVSPDNKHTEDAPVFIDNDVTEEPAEETPEEEKPRKVSRSAKSGEFVSEKEAKSKPSTTVTETV